jgi:hypothetical protein
MADSAIFVGWGQVVRGREAKALAVFNETLTYYGGLQQAGTIESFEPVLLNAHGGDLAGFVLIRGERSKLDALKSSDEFLRNTYRANLIVENLGIIDASIGATLTSGLATFAAQLADLT